MSGFHWRGEGHRSQLAQYWIDGQAYLWDLDSVGLTSVLCGSYVLDDLVRPQIGVCKQMSIMARV